MKKLTLIDPEMQSADGVAENIAKLKALFPELVTEGVGGAAINVDVLKALVGDATVTDGEEKYGLNWHGKRLARQLALTPSTGTLRPCPGESVDWETTGNLMIEGDNLEVLKLLQKSYAGRVKMIYIDPPYNTGKDFVYPDDFQDNIHNYLVRTGQVDGEGWRVTSNTEASGRFHTDWLNMMYPRLRLARNLLRDDGVICISIDDNEAMNLRTICNEIYGEENFIATVVWQKAYTANQTARHISDTHDYVVIYAKNNEQASFGKLERTEDQIAKFANPDNDPRGPWKAENLSAGKYYSAGQFEIEGPTGKKFLPPDGRYWRCNEKQYLDWLNDGRITFGQSGEGRPMLKKFLGELESGLTPTTWWPHEQSGSNKSASIDLKDLFNGQAVFDTPKPVELVERLVQLTTDHDSLVLDFFAGSGVTAHAVMIRNSKENSQRKHISIQIPEATTNVDFPFISHITCERLRRSGKKIKEESPLFAGDIGFRVFKLDSSNIRPWQPDRNDLAGTLLAHAEPLVAGRGEEDILFELLLKLGLELTVPMAHRTFAGKTVHSIGLGTLMVCLAPQVKRSDVEPLAQGIIEWWRELDPAVPVQFVFRDSGFVDDVAKTNMAVILEQNIPANRMNRPTGIHSL